jgi:hypothetical protein
MPSSCFRAFKRRFAPKRQGWLVAVLGLALIVRAALPDGKAQPGGGEPKAASSKPAAGSPLSPESQLIYETKVKPFLEAHCVKCHDENTTLANFRIDTLGVDFLADKTGDNWKEVYDNISLGKMPKKKKLTPAEAAEANLVTDWIDQEVRNAEQRAKKLSGRTQMRRLNRAEFANCLRDLFGLDEAVARGIEEELQPDAAFAGFDRSSASLFIDPALLHKYYEIAGKVLERDVFGPKPATRKIIDYARDIKWANGASEKMTRASTWPRIAGDYLNLRNDQVLLPVGATIYQLKNGGIEYLTGGENIGGHDSSMGAMPFAAGGGTWAQKVHTLPIQSKESGLYRFKVRAGAFKGKGKFALDEVKFTYEHGKDFSNLDTATVVIDAPLDQPKDYEFTLFLHFRDIGFLRSRFTWNGLKNRGEPLFGASTDNDLVQWAPEVLKAEMEFTKKFQRLGREMRDARISKDKAKIAQLDEEIKDWVDKGGKQYHEFMVNFKGPLFIYNPKIDLDSVPRLRLESIEVEGPLVEWPSPGRKRLLFDGEERPLDQKYLREILARFLPRAFRRAVSADEVDNWVSWVEQAQRQNNLTGLEALKKGIKAILCSPDFMMLQEPTGTADKPRPLGDHELASRLSFFLWSSMPDDELVRLAADGKLHETKTLEAQARRLIASPKAAEFVRNFAGQWLKIRDFGNTNTDRTQYKTYTDDFRKSTWREPFEFFAEVLRSNLSVLNFVDSDFVVVDERLAKHYGIDGVVGDQFRKVAIRPEHHRGGVLGMAGVLTYLTDGFRTLPVRRAAYVLDTLWNDPPKPPPPNAGDLPVVKGNNLTVRQRLQQHRDSLMCASCHARVDPFGVALENYDAIGAWRERQNGEGFRGDAKSPALDVSGELPSQRKFSNLAEYKQALLAEKERFVSGFTEKMLTYALNRPISRTADRATIAQIARQLETDDFRFQAMIGAIVTSEAFRTK